MASGAHAVRSFGEPKYFEDDAGKGFVPIDTSLVQDPSREGWLRVAGNAWLARFGPLSEGGVELTVNGDVVRLSPLAPRGDVRPELVREEGSSARFGESTVGNQVLYREVWPGVDVRYTVSSAAVREDIVVKSTEGAASLGGFRLEGGSLVEATPGLGIAKGALEVQTPGLEALRRKRPADVFRFVVPPPLVVLGSGEMVAGRAAFSVRPAGDAGAVLHGGRVEPVPGGSWDVDLGVDRAWLAGQSFPVIVDPSTEITPSSVTWGSYNSAGTLALGTSYAQMLGNSRAFGADDYWLSVTQFDMSTVKNAGGRVTRARLEANAMASPPAQYSPALLALSPYSNWASSWTYVGAQAGNVMAFPGGSNMQTFDRASDNFSGAACYYVGCNERLPSNNATQIDVTDMSDFGVAASGYNTGSSYLTLASSIAGQAGSYTLRQSQVSLWVIYDVPSVKPTLVSPLDGQTLVTTQTPTLQVSGLSDPDGGPAIKFIIGQGPNPTAKLPNGSCAYPGAQVAASDWLPTGTTSWAVPAGVLRDGGKYWWGVVSAWNGTILGWPQKMFPICSDARSFTVDRRLGSGGVSPTESVGSVTVNSSTGNVTTGFSTVGVNTLGGGIGVSASYNSQAPSTAGLRGQYFYDADHSGTLNPSVDPLVLQRTDSQIDFDYQRGPAFPGSNDADWFFTRWTGYLTSPAGGTYLFGTASDDWSSVYVGGTQVVSAASYSATPTYGTTQVSFAPGESKAVTIDHSEQTGAAFVSVWAKNVSTGVESKLNEVFALSTDPKVLPAGWKLSAGGVGVASAIVGESFFTITGDDGSTTRFDRKDGGDTYVGPAGTSDVVTRTTDGAFVYVSGTTTYTFGSDGLLQLVTSASDDRAPAATQYDWATVGNVPRLVGLRDPVTNRSVTLTYQVAGSTCPTSPPTGGAAPTGLAVAPGGMLCRVSASQFGGGDTDLWYYANGNLGFVRNPGDATIGYSDVGFGWSSVNGLLESVQDPLASDAIRVGLRSIDTSTQTKVLYDGAGRAVSVTGPRAQPASVAGTPAAQTVTFQYDSTPSGDPQTGTLGYTRVQASGTAQPNTYTSKVGFDTAYRTRERFAANGVKSAVAYEQGFDRVSYTDTAVGTGQWMRTSTIYDQTTQFNTAGLPVTSWGPAPAAWFSGPTPTGGHNETDIARTLTGYDEGFAGLGSTYWNNATFSAAPVAHGISTSGAVNGRVDGNWGTGSPMSGQVTSSVWSAQWDGWINLPAGTNRFATIADGQVSLSVDGRLLFDLFRNPDGTPRPDPGSNVRSPDGVFEATAGWHRVTLRYAQNSGNAELHLYHQNPGGSTWPLAENMKPDWGLVTSTTGPDGVVTTSEYGTGGSLAPYGLVTKSVVDPGGLKLTSATTYETPSATTYLRRTARSLPGGFDATGAAVTVAGGAQAATSTYTHYGAGDTTPRVSRGPLRSRQVSSTRSVRPGLHPRVVCRRTRPWRIPTGTGPLFRWCGLRCGTAWAVRSRSRPPVM